jgi:hypothetical protein
MAAVLIDRLDDQAELPPEPLLQPETRTDLRRQAEDENR